MDISLYAISPVNGRYSSKVKELAPYFSEFGLIRERCRIEVEYLLALSGIKLIHMPPINPDQAVYLRKCYEDMSAEDAQQVKDIERQTNHDVKAVEYFLKRKLDEHGMSVLKEWIHFGLTSQDINNTAVPAFTKRAVNEIMIPSLKAVIHTLEGFSKEWLDAPMLCRTHGQAATPSTMGKEIAVFAERLGMQLEELEELKYYGKFGGATGNFNAHKVAYPDVDWPSFANRFLESLGLEREQFTTQIDHYDHLARLFHIWQRINTILIDLCRDIWTYISMEYLTQKAVAGEVGSSTMPHKVNPIDFENAEGNLGVANALFGHFAEKLPVSRLQRDLTDSTVLRNIGVPFAHTLISLKSISRGLGKISLNRARLSQDLDEHWIILAEAVQTILRREGVEEPYELLKSLTRGSSKLTREELHAFIDTLKVREEVREELRSLTPHTYIGYAGTLLNK